MRFKVAEGVVAFVGAAVTTLSPSAASVPVLCGGGDSGINRYNIYDKSQSG